MAFDDGDDVTTNWFVLQQNTGIDTVLYRTYNTLGLAMILRASAPHHDAEPNTSYVRSRTNTIDHSMFLTSMETGKVSVAISGWCEDFSKLFK